MGTDLNSVCFLPKNCLPSWKASLLLAIYKTCLKTFNILFLKIAHWSDDNDDIKV